MRKNFDVVIAGGGIIGLSVARSLLMLEPKLKVLVVEKETTLGAHASGRNSGVLHAGFYYSPESLKAKFCHDGNLLIRELALMHNIPVRDVGKVVVARNSDEVARLETLYRRGVANGIQLEFLDAQALGNFEPLASTYERFLWSPTTAVSDPRRIIEAIYNEVLSLGVEVRFGARLEVTSTQQILVNEEPLSTNHFVNAAGTQSDRIAHRYNLGLEYSMIPFIGFYRAVAEVQLPLKRLVYPVPHPINPFLGVHFTLTTDHKVKIGPTAIPISGREQYAITQGWSLSDIQSTFGGISSMLRHGAHDLPALIRSEWPKIFTSTLVAQAAELVPEVKQVKGWRRLRPGIRAQLINRGTGEFVQDFIIEEGSNSTHVLNVVSPGWTAAIPFSIHIANRVLERLENNPPVVG